MTHIDQLGIKHAAEVPLKPIPILIIGAGGIVNDAHLPAYKIAKFKVAGIFDADINRAFALAEHWAIPEVFNSIQQMVENAPKSCVYDIAVPAYAIRSVLEALPNSASILMQKPMGNDLKEAEDILKLCHDKKLNAAVNFQLRYAPYILAAKDMIAKGLIGRVCDIEVNVNVYTPWHLWKFLYDAPRVEITYHSIHYVDLIRSVLGNPYGVFAKTTKHPDSAQLASVRSDIILDYGDFIRANIHTNHNHVFGTKHQSSYIKIEGTKGAIKLQMGLLMNYPTGMIDKFEYIRLGQQKDPAWEEVKIPGSWFPEAFIGSMSEVMRFNEGRSPAMDNSVEDAIWTMRAVEQAYQSNFTPLKF